MGLACTRTPLTSSLRRLSRAHGPGSLIDSLVNYGKQGSFSRVGLDHGSPAPNSTRQISHKAHFLLSLVTNFLPWDPCQQQKKNPPCTLHGCLALMSCSVKLELRRAMFRGAIVIRSIVRCTCELQLFLQCKVINFFGNAKLSDVVRIAQWCNMLHQAL